jgi:hypothetical protein
MILTGSNSCIGESKNKRKFMDANITKSPIENVIQEIRGQRVILDSDLAALYGVETRVLMQQCAGSD